MLVTERKKNFNSKSIQQYFAFKISDLVYSDIDDFLLFNIYKQNGEGFQNSISIDVNSIKEVQLYIMMPSQNGRLTHVNAYVRYVDGSELKRVHFYSIHGTLRYKSKELLEFQEHYESEFKKLEALIILKQKQSKKEI